MTTENKLKKIIKEFRSSMDENENEFLISLDRPTAFLLCIFSAINEPYFNNSNCNINTVANDLLGEILDNIIHQNMFPSLADYYEFRELLSDIN